MENTKSGLLKRTVIWLKGGSREENSTPDVSGEQSVFMQRATLMAFDNVLEERRRMNLRIIQRIMCILAITIVVLIWF